MLRFSDLNFQNPWWRSQRVPKIFLGRKRAFLKKIQKYLPLKQAILIYGLRRIGKTTLFYQLIQELIDSKIAPEQILYFSFDEKVISIKDLLRLYEIQVLQQPLDAAGKVYLFLDEVQKLKDWQDQVKIIYDHYPNLKIFLSGSASINLQRKSTESLAGRVFEFEFEPLSFEEFLRWKGMEINLRNLDLYEKELKILAQEYILKGGFPEIVEEADREIIRLYLKNSVLDKIVAQDLPLEFSLKDPELLKALLEVFFTNPGKILNYDALASDYQRSKVTIINYVFYLKYALLLREVRNFRPSLRVSSRKGKKIYPSNSAFCFIYSYDNQVLQERVLETAVASLLKAQYYYRNSFEIDFLVRKGQEFLPVEVKSGKVEFRQLERFMKKFKSRRGFIISQDYQIEREGVEVIPFWRVLVKGKLV